MVVEEGPPRLRRPSLPALLPMTADRLRTDLETQTAQLALDAFRPPVAVLSSHKDDEPPGTHSTCAGGQARGDS